MSQSVKDGKHGGAHKGGHAGREYWGRRPGARMGAWGRASKVLTHRAERREAKAAVAVDAE